MEICAKEQCTGCSACENICPVVAISMVADHQGFLRPAIDPHKCVSCHKCERICPQNDTANIGTQGRVLAALARNDTVREESSSGGIFSLLAQQVLKKGGVVFGAAYGEDLTVKHIAVTDITNLSKLRGSKYVQSKVGYAYQEAKQYLDTGKSVLYSGTPCQIAGLKAYLGKEYTNLLTIDILCHGVPSPAVFRMHAEALQKQCQQKIVDIRFRSKRPGWKNFSTQLVFADGQCKSLSSDPYMDGFLKNIYLRESCYQCVYASPKRVGDITLGDFWGYQESAPQYIMDDDRGITLVMVNTKIGKKAFNGIRGQIASAPRTMEDACKGNPILSHPSAASQQKDSFWKRYPSSTWEQLCEDFSLGKNTIRDYISAEDRAYFAQPFDKRHPIHVLRRYKNALFDRRRRK